MVLPWARASLNSEVMVERYVIDHNSRDRGLNEQLFGTKRRRHEDRADGKPRHANDVAC